MLRPKCLRLFLSSFACTNANQFTLPLNFGSLDVKGAACPVKSGTELTIPAVAAVSAHCPNGKLVATLTAPDGAGNVLFDLEYDIAM